MKNRPLISICNGAKRPKLWMKMYKSLCYSDISFEVIYVGPKCPDFVLPSNFKFIYSKVKPAQAVEIAVRNCKGEFVINIPDDHTISKNGLKILYENFIKYNNDRLIISGIASQNKKLLPIKKSHVIYKDTTSPLMPIAGLFKKKIWEKMGGLDRNFIAALWDVDLAMRIMEIGGGIIFCENVILDETVSRHERKKSLIINFGNPFDRKYFHLAWLTKEKKFSPKRLLPLELFEEKNILTISQGPKGKWE